MNMGVLMNVHLLGVLITCVSQFSETLRANNSEARRIFGEIEPGKIMFCGSNIKNPILSKVCKRNFNYCCLGDANTVAQQKENECRMNFFQGDWM